MNLTKQKSNALEIYDPARGLKEIAVAESAEEYARRARDLSLMIEAVTEKLRAQAEFIRWWDAPSRNKAQGERTDLELHRADATKLRVGKEGIPNKDVLARWREIAKNLDKKTRDAIERCRRVCEGIEKPDKPEPLPIPDGKYGTIVIDPPWDMTKIEREVAVDQTGFDYPTMNAEELKAFDVESMAADDCHLFCWTTQKHNALARELFEHWGFKFILEMVWHKSGGFQPFGLPQYNCEFILYGRRGSPKFADTKNFFCCNSWPRREHSRKPDEFYDLVRRVTDGPRIDVFSRETREGFSQFGNETDKFSV